LSFINRAPGTPSVSILWYDLWPLQRHKHKTFKIIVFFFSYTTQSKEEKHHWNFMPSKMNKQGMFTKKSLFWFLFFVKNFYWCYLAKVWKLSREYSILWPMSNVLKKKVNRF
jgi:hypothetical protein